MNIRIFLQLFYHTMDLNFPGIDSHFYSMTGQIINQHGDRNIIIRFNSTAELIAWFSIRAHIEYIFVLHDIRKTLVLKNIL